MNVTLDVMPPKEKLRQDPKHKRDIYAHLDLPEEVKNQTVYFKLEGVGDFSDTHHSTAHTWNEEFVEHPKIDMTDADGDHPFALDEDGRGTSLEAGLIFRFKGRFVGNVALNPETRIPFASEAEAELVEEMNNTRFPRFSKWDFRLDDVIYTDGPARRERLSEDADNQRAHAEEESHKAQADFFKAQTSMILSLIEKVSQGGGQAVDINALKDAVGIQPPPKDINPDQAAAMEEIEEAQKVPGTPRRVLDIEVKPVEK